MLLVKKSSNEGQLAAFIILLQTLAAIENYKPLSNADTGYSITESEGLRMNDIYQYTMSHYTRQITLKQIASVAHLSPQAFCRYFKKHTRKNYINFLNEIRVTESCKKLVSKEFDNIALVAYNSGFNNVTTYNRVFKQILKKSPSEYIRAFMSGTQ